MDRLTEKTVGCFQYALKDHKAEVGEFGTYEAFFDYSVAVKKLGEYEDTGLTPNDIKRLSTDTLPKARWKWTPSGALYCKGCDQFAPYPMETAYCPNCGAKMEDLDGENDEA